MLEGETKLLLSEKPAYNFFVQLHFFQNFLIHSLHSHIHFNILVHQAFEIQITTKSNWVIMESNSFQLQSKPATLMGNDMVCLDLWLFLACFALTPFHIEMFWPTYKYLYYVCKNLVIIVCLLLIYCGMMHIRLSHFFLGHLNPGALHVALKWVNYRHFGGYWEKLYTLKKMKNNTVTCIFFKIYCNLKKFIVLSLWDLNFKNCYGKMVLRPKCWWNWELFIVKLERHITFCHYKWQIWPYFFLNFIFLIKHGLFQPNSGCILL